MQENPITLDRVKRLVTSLGTLEARVTKCEQLLIKLASEKIREEKKEKKDG